MNGSRPLLIVLLAASFAFGLLVSKAQESVVPEILERPRILSSSIFDWNAFAVKKTAKGEYRKVMQAPTATLDELECHITTLNPGEEAHPPHQHPDEEIIVIKEGLVEALVNGEIKKVGPGSVIFQAANQLHSIRNAGDTPATYHVIKWNSPGMLGLRRK